MPASAFHHLSLPHTPTPHPASAALQLPTPNPARSATGRKHHIIWQPELDPPPLLADVCVVLVGPKKPISCGTVARACSCFECEDVRVVTPRCDHNTR